MIFDFKKAFDWCEQNLDFIRQAGKENAQLMLKLKTWDIMAEGFRSLYNECLKDMDIAYGTEVTRHKKLTIPPPIIKNLTKLFILASNQYSTGWFGRVFLSPIFNSHEIGAFSCCVQ